MKCSQCGLENPDQGNFCLHCGQPLNAQGQVINTNTPAAVVVKPEDNAVRLTPEDEMTETVHFNEHPSMRTALPSMLLIGILGIGAILLLGLLERKPGEPLYLGLPILQAIALAVTVVLLIGVWLNYFIRTHSTGYKLTSQRIFLATGLLNKRTDEIELEKYKDVIVHQSFMNKMMGCGDVKIVTGDSTDPTVDMIDVIDPIGKKELIRSAARQRKSDLGINRREEL